MAIMRWNFHASITCSVFSRRTILLFLRAFVVISGRGRGGVKRHFRPQRNIAGSGVAKTLRACIWHHCLLTRAFAVATRDAPGWLDAEGRVSLRRREI